MKIPLLLAFIASTCLAAEDGGDWEFLKQHLPKEENEFTTLRSPQITNTFRFLPAALVFMEGAEKITVFEGLPHPTWDAELLKSELARVDETMIGEFPFYPLPQAMRKDDEATLRKLLSVPDHIRPFLYFKMCGGFHPDFAIRFTKGEQLCEILLCFGCGDGIILHDGKTIHCHISGWKELMTRYARQHPKTK